jgi:hypothetical protein
MKATSVTHIFIPLTHPAHTLHLLQTASRLVMQEAYKRGSGDNICALVVDLKERLHASSRGNDGSDASAGGADE